VRGEQNERPPADATRDRCDDFSDLVVECFVFGSDQVVGRQTRAWCRKFERRGKDHFLDSGPSPPRAEVVEDPPTASVAEVNTVERPLRVHMVAQEETKRCRRRAKQQVLCPRE